MLGAAAISACKKGMSWLGCRGQWLSECIQHGIGTRGSQLAIRRQALQAHSWQQTAHGGMSPAATLNVRIVWELGRQFFVHTVADVADAADGIRALPASLCTGGRFVRRPPMAVTARSK